MGKGKTGRGRMEVKKEEKKKGRKGAREGVPGVGGGEREGRKRGGG